MVKERLHKRGMSVGLDPAVTRGSVTACALRSRNEEDKINK